MVFSVVIVGCGVIGNRLANAFDKHEEINITGCCDLILEKAKEMSENYSCNPYTSYKEMIELEVPDLVYIGVPPAYHFEIANYSIEMGKAVLCEKPLTLTSENARKLTTVEASSDVVTGVNLPFRYDPGFLKLKKMIKEDELGKIKRVTLKFRFPQWPRYWQDVEWLSKSYQGGPLREVGTHFYFGILELFDSVEKVLTIVEYDDPEFYEKGAWGFMLLKNKILVSLDLLTDVSEPEENTLIIHGSQKTVSFEGWYKLIEINIEGERKVLYDEGYDASYHLVNEMINAMSGKSADLVSFQEAARAQYILDAILTSSGEWLEL